MVNTGDHVLFNVKNNNNKTTLGRSQKKDRSIYTHCGYHDYTIEKCYKLHGYPMGYKMKQKNPNGLGPNFMNSTNHFSSNTMSQVSEGTTNTQGMGEFMQSLNST